MLRDRWFADSPVEGDGFDPSVPHKKQPFLAAPVRSRNSPSATKTGSFVPGTDGSNPSPSTGESASSGRRCRAACRQHFARILGVTSRRYRRRTDEIAEHDRELVALSVASALRCGRGLRRPGDSFDYQLPATAAKPRYRLVLKATRRAGNGQSRATLSAKAPRLCVCSHAARATHKVLRGEDRSPQPYLTGGSLRS